ncbi:hypothetical protein AA103196_2275 [Ameyamaea chiangmaiensis NBRC 103196]|uniref:Uncharacterized protein n=1 Tax=Ameyamaea chiangmaiensis TaxID=442969 RepID=A0A850PAR2_9PROT|nr:hypothetical protein [Ameyamaea chiangmaiensis]MBS4075466.1 hypothetical protein [Ameyamaea chiangmaiensis]NVN39002.1 hypothetical protein [Ameyamaea chiangmaiensis]GBQ69667.1 hypothetical protein AA103196_2275 [Ameyamaea chiangmaiensis NBRC 103196]
MSIDWDGLVLDACQDTFGEPVVWQSSQLPSPVSITGIFSDGYRAADLIGGDDGVSPVHISASVPMLGVQLSQFTVAPLQGDLMTVRGVTWRVREVQPDSFGAARLELVCADGENDPLPCGVAQPRW